MTLNEIDSYLNDSKALINNAKNKLMRLGYYCPYINMPNPMPGYPLRFQIQSIQELENRQRQLEGMAYAERHRDGSMGIWWLAVGVVGVASSYIAAYVYDHYTKAKMQSDYLDCLEKYQTQYGKSPEEAASICGQGGDSLKESIQNTIKLVIYGGVAIMALYVASKYFIKK